MKNEWQRKTRLVAQWIENGCREGLTIEEISHDIRRQCGDHNFDHAEMIAGIKAAKHYGSITAAQAEQL